MVTKTPKYVLKKIEDFVREAVSERFGEDLPLHDVCIVAHEDPFGEERVHMYVVYDADPSKVDPDWAVRLISLVIDYMPEEELLTMPLKEFIHKSEWPEFYHYNVAPWIRATS